MTESASKGAILVVDDERRQREIYRDILQDEGYQTETASSGEAALHLLAQKRFDLILTDLNLTGMTGVELLSEILAADPTVAVILITGYPSIQSAIEATKKGVYQYLEKPVDRDKLLAVVGDVFEHLATLKQTIIGSSAATKAMVRMILKVAPASHTVLILGESGTGKELVARQIHNHSPRHDKPFLAVNCAALTETLLESELFGHEKGAFTDAHQQKKGLFERAHHSTLFLDEIGDTSLGMQAKILRVLQEREFLRVGGTEPIKVDVRIIAATNKNLEQMLKEAKFREDLYYRLKVIPIVCPPLRERREDIKELALHFMHKAALVANREVKGISTAALEVLETYDWPGNVRELEMTIERAVLLGETDQVELPDLPSEILERPAERVMVTPAEGAAAAAGAGGLEPVIPEGSWEEHEKAKIMEALQRTNGNITKAAHLLGMTFRTLQYRLEKFGIKRP
ncbi:MAG TPA: sigma-54 dependent transcriptional regulator [Terriglobia bacterium]|nr:sigma-54 dependent transcriptional regulator [Terriglobia bacterium]